jgi:hypothetical protein
MLYRIAILAAALGGGPKQRQWACWAAKAERAALMALR